MLADPSLPLQGIRVVDLTQNVAGPFATLILADLGAEVVKIERPDTGDDTRAWGPPFWSTGDSAYFLALNRNKESLSLNLRDPAAVEIMRRLVDRSDVLVESYRPSVMNGLGFGWEWAHSVNPALVYVQVTAFGTRGPLKDRPGYDPLMQAFCGHMSINGEPGRPPIRVGYAVNDMGTGLWAALATVSALYRRRDTGKGEHVVTALYETALTWLSMHVALYWAGGEVPQPLGSGAPGIVPYRAFPVQDGFVVISAGNDRLFARLSEALGHSEWIQDPRFTHNRDRSVNRDVVDQLIEAETRRFTATELEALLAEKGVPCAPVRTLDRVVDDEAAAVLGLFQPHDDGVPPGFKAQLLPVRLGERRPALRQRPPSLGEHNADVLRRLGFTHAEVESLLKGPALRSRKG